ncbi:MAG TPA: L,D-transpeptidase family protein [Gaiellaceae bacterium]|nr:L,D-transpeptidase family protein [Gaiellaceae bacterium]
MALAVHVVAAALAAACPSYPSVPPATTQLITVNATRLQTTSATLRTWRREGDCWAPVAGPYTARVGWNGLRVNRHEGDGTTPIGTFPILRRMYGNDPNPGVHFGYTLLRCGDWWVEDPRSPAYNTFRRIGCGVKPPFKVTTPDMSKSRRAYAYLAVIGFNTGPVVPGRGSGIFLHVQVHNSTNGCVSLPRPQLLRVLRWLTPTAAPRIVIGLGL